MTKIDINSDEPINIREWVQLHAAGTHPKFVTTVPIAHYEHTESLEKRGFLKLVDTLRGDVMANEYRQYELTPEGLAFFNFIRNIAPR